MHLTTDSHPTALRRFFFVLLAGVGLVLTGCSGDSGGSGTASSDSGAPATPAEDKSIELVYVEWSDAVASSNMVRAVLEHKLGYEVELTPVSAAAMWEGVATGDVDGMVAAWLPTTHESYKERTEGRVEDLGPNLDGTKIGLVVPSYVTIDSINDLAANADQFGSRIVGIDPGAGLMAKSEVMLEEYGLGDFELVEGSGATMTAALSDAIDNDEWVVVTGWTPHWKFARWDLKYLEDPKGVYGGAEQIHTVVRTGLAEDHPEAYAFLDAFSWTPEQIGEVMAMNREDGSDPYDNAVEWMNANPDVVNGWFGR